MCSRKFAFKLCIISLFDVYTELSAIRHATSNCFLIVFYIKLLTSELYLAGTIRFSLLITPVNVITSFSTVPYWSLTTEISAKWQNIMLTQFCLFVCSWFQWLTWHSFAANNSYYIALHCRYINWLLGKNFDLFKSLDIVQLF